MKSFEYKGLWWLSEYPDKKIAGVVTFSQEEGISLELIGSFGIFGEEEEFDREYPIILGTSTNDKDITLYNCSMVSRRNFHELNKTGGSCEFFVQTAFVDVHISSTESFNFYKASTTFSHLTNWVGNTSGLKIGNLKENSSEIYKETISYEFLEPVKIETSKGNINISFRNSSSFNKHSFRIEEKIWIDFENFGDKRFEEIIKEYIYPLRNLINLLTDEYNFVEELLLYSQDCFYERDEERFDIPIQVFYQQSFYPTKSKKDNHRDIILYYEQVSKDLPLIFERWLKCSTEFDEVLNTYFWVQGISEGVNGRSFVEEFLMIIRAIEVYHRRSKKNVVLPEEEHIKRISEIISSAPREYKNWLKGRIYWHSNEPTLKNRLRDLIEEREELLIPLIKEKDAFIKLVGDTRNYYTHFGEDLKEKAAKGSELYKLSDKLALLLKSCLLSEIGITLEKQIEIFLGNWHYDFVKKS